MKLQQIPSGEFKGKPQTGRINILAVHDLTKDNHPEYIKNFYESTRKGQKKRAIFKK